MARGDGIHHTNARNMRLTAARIGNAQQHNEREKGSYVNQDINVIKLIFKTLNHL